MDGRIKSTFSENDISVNVRIEQGKALWETWKQQLIFGYGYGMSSSVVRDAENPFTYEVMPLALLMKLGLVGVSGFFVFFGYVAFSLVKQSEIYFSETKALLSALTSFAVSSLSNPLLLNFVGMGILSFLLICWLYVFKPNDDLSNLSENGV